MSNPSDIQKELEQLIREKFGSKLNILSTTATITTTDDNKDGSSTGPTKQQKDSDSDDFHLQAFNKTPKEVKHYLDQFVISQDEAKKSLAIAICNHYNQILYHHRLSEDEKSDYVYAKQNVLLIGPTGVGKTYMIRQIAKLIDVPFVRADATKYSETGYVGGNVEDMIRDLVQQADDDITRAEYGIVYIDEADKLATSSHRSHDISGRGVQLNLLKLLEETEVDLRGGHDPVAQIQTIMEMHATGNRPAPKMINTKHILFILSGSFNGLTDIIAKRKSINAIGFSDHNQNSTHTTHANPRPSPQSAELLAELKTEDLIKFGYEPEFVGRLPVRVFCRSLSVADLFEILKTAQGNIIKQYTQALAAYDIQAEFKDSAFQEIAKQAHLENTGARSLSTILDQALKDFIYELPSLKVNQLIIDGELIKNPQTVLAHVIQEATAAMATEAQTQATQAHNKINHTTENPNNDQDNNDNNSDDDKAYYHQLKQAILAYPDYFQHKHGVEICFDISSMELLMSKYDGKTATIESYLNQQLKRFENTITLIAYLRADKSVLLTRESIENPETTFQEWIQTAVAQKEQEKSRSTSNQEPTTQSSPPKRKKPKTSPKKSNSKTTTSSTKPTRGRPKKTKPPAS